MPFCPTCGAQIAEGATCLKCAGAPAAPASTATTTGTGLTDNVAGALAYVTIIPAIAFLVLEPYNRKRFIRFHCFQCIFFAVAWTALWIILSIIGHIPLLGWATLLLWPLVSLAGFHPLAGFGSQGLPGPDVQAPHNWRYGGKAGRRVGNGARGSI